MVSILAFSLSNIGSLLLFIILLCGIIAWHELGHLLVAKKCNVYCYEYSIGFGPILYRNKKHETHFVLRAIPLGGFVRMAGEEGLEEGQVVEDNNGNPVPSCRVMGNLPKGKKVAVMAAGGVMNLILAVVCFYICIAFTGGFSIARDDSRIRVQQDSALYDAGMRSGDKITHITAYLNDDTSTTIDQNVNKISQVSNALDSTKPVEVGDVQYITITYADTDENESLKTIDVTRSVVLNEETNQPQMTYIGLSQYADTYTYNPFTAIWGSFHYMGENTVAMFKAFGRIFTGDLSQLSGLVGIYNVVDEVATDTNYTVGQRIINVISLAGAISFSLGFFNLIPFPALDGGRITFVAIEAVTKKKINPNVEATIHFVGLILLFALMVIVNIKDIFNIFGG